MGKIRSNKGMPNNSNKSKKSKKPISDKPNNEAVEYFDKGLALINLGKNEEAIVYLDKALFLDSNNTNAYINRGVALINLGKNKEAIEYFDKALFLDPNNVLACSNKGVALDTLGEYKEAIKYFDIVIDKHSTNANTYLGKGASLAKLGKLEESIVYFNKALVLDPKNSSAYLNIGLALARLDRLEEAIDCYNEIIKIEPENINTYIDKGMALGRLYKLEKALDCFKDALTIDPYSTGANFGKGLILYKLNKHIECHQWIQGCITKNIISYRIFSALYLFYKDNKDYEQDIEEYIQKTIAIEYDKNSEGTEFYQYSPLSKEIIYNITNQEIHFSNPNNFNDPFDPLIRILNKDDSEGMLKLLNFRISCLSKNNKNILMWSHYANKHQGICIKYNIAKLLKEKDIIFKKTEYIKTMPQPQSGFHLELSDTTTIIDAFTQKHDSWEYEEEYKLIVRTDENTPVLKKCDIEEIYLGKDVSPKDAEFIKKTVDNKNNTDGTNIKLYQMKINDYNIFELEEQEL